VIVFMAYPQFLLLHSISDLTAKCSYVRECGTGIVGNIDPLSLLMKSNYQSLN